jgi:hypothetical protein
MYLHKYVRLNQFLKSTTGRSRILITLCGSVLLIIIWIALYMNMSWARTYYDTINVNACQEYTSLIGVLDRCAVCACQNPVQTSGDKTTSIACLTTLLQCARDTSVNLKDYKIDKNRTVACTLEGTIDSLARFVNACPYQSLSTYYQGAQEQCMLTLNFKIEA